jgi:hypothetical protein
VGSIVAVALALCLAVGAGLASTWLAVRSPTPVDVIQSGPWAAWPRAGTPEGDPYSRARLARSGELPLGSGEGLAVIAASDDGGEPLRGDCDYRVEGQMPAARLWTLAVERADGLPLPSTSVRRAIGSDSVLRANDGVFSIAVSPRPQAGNWLSGQGAQEIRLVARLYDTTARAVTPLTRLVMPRITRERCP